MENDALQTKLRFCNLFWVLYWAIHGKITTGHSKAPVRKCHIGPREIAGCTTGWECSQVLWANLLRDSNARIATGTATFSTTEEKIGIQTDMCTTYKECSQCSFMHTHTVHAYVYGLRQITYPIKQWGRPNSWICPASSDASLKTWCRLPATTNCQLTAHQTKWPKLSVYFLFSACSVFTTNCCNSLADVLRSSRPIPSSKSLASWSHFFKLEFGLGDWQKIIYGKTPEKRWNMGVEPKIGGFTTQNGWWK